MGTTQRITRKYKVAVSELQSWSAYSGDKSEDLQEWVETDMIETAKKASLAAYLRGLADELEPKKPTTRGEY